MNYRKKVLSILLISLLTISLVAPAAFANERVSLLFNGQEYQANLYIKDGVSYISATSLSKIPGLGTEQDGYVALRSFFEGKGGEVKWNGKNNQITVSWREKQEQWTVDNLLVQSTAKMQELNTYKMQGEAIMNMTLDGASAEEIPAIPETTTYLEAVFQQDPLAMYMLQTVKLPLEDMDLTEEELALIGQTEMTTEMVWKDNAIYQKMPPFEQWIVQDLAELGMMDQLTNLMQVTPQQSLEMMNEFGVINVFGEETVIDGEEYYTVKTYIDSEIFKKLLDEMLGEFDLVELINSNPGLSEQENVDMEQVMAEAQEMIKQMFANMELNYYIDSLIHKESLLTEYMTIDLDMKFELDEKIVPEGPISMAVHMVGDFVLSDFGAEIQLPDVTDAITQQEFLEQLQDMMQAQEEMMGAEESELIIK